MAFVMSALTTAMPTVGVRGNVRVAPKAVANNASSAHVMPQIFINTDSTLVRNPDGPTVYGPAQSPHRGRSVPGGNQ